MMAEIWREPYYGPVVPICEDRPSMQRNMGGVRLELTGRDAVWLVELTGEEIRRIIELVAEWQEH